MAEKSNPSVLWEAEPHTLAKHAILKNYLDAWAVIFSRTPNVRELLFYDGFAGPGEYSGGEPGSPVVALNALRANTQQLKPVRLKFSEIDPSIFDQLKSKLTAETQKLPTGCSIKVDEPSLGDCNDHIRALSAERKSQRLPLGPALFFLDQFGYSQVPMSLIRELMSQQYCEVFSYLNCQRLIPYLTDDTKAPGIIGAFGNESWRAAVHAPDRQQAVIDLYIEALKSNGKVKYPWAFAMFDSGGHLIYWLVFSTNDLKGLEVMKKAMWKVDATGTYRFSDRDDPRQQRFFSTLSDEWLADELSRSLMGRTLTEDQVREHVLTKTPFYRYKDPINLLRKQEKVTPRSKGQYPVTFI